jgi:Flp pilus assembly pilin Flp
LESHLRGKYTALGSEFGRGQVRARFTKYWANESGSTVIEHAIVVCVMALVIVYAVGTGLSPGEALRRIALLTDAIFTNQPAADTDGSGARPPNREGMTIDERTGR